MCIHYSNTHTEMHTHTHTLKHTSESTQRGENVIMTRSKRVWLTSSHKK